MGGTLPASQWGEVLGEATARLAEQFLGNPFFDDTAPDVDPCVIAR